MSSRYRRHRLIVGAGISAGAAFALAPAADAAVFEVDNNSDVAAQNDCTVGNPGACSLRGALSISNITNNTPDTITFASSLSGQTISLATNQLLISDAVTISGLGADRLAVTGNDSVRVLRVATPAGEAVSISGLTLRDGDSTGGAAGDDSGGAISKAGAELTLEGVAVTGSTAYDGGGIDIESGSTVVRNSTVAGNVASGTGGISSPVTNTDIINSTISGNQSFRPPAAGGVDTAGGFLSDAYSYIYSSTITGNSSDTGAAGVQLESLPDAADDGFISNSIIANNGGDPADLQGQVSAEGSLVETPGAASSITQDGSNPNLTGIDPQLGPLAANGGPTLTHRPTATSPVLDRGFSLLPTDQRGQTRAFDLAAFPNAVGGNSADSGSVELQLADLATPVTPVTQPPAPTAPVCKKKKKKPKKRAGAAACKKKKKKKRN